MLTKYFLEFIIYILGQFLTLLSSAFPDFNYLSTLTSAIQTLLGVSTQVVNFFYFMFGDFLHTAIFMVSWLLPFKFIVCPMIGFLRKIVVWGGN